MLSIEDRLAIEDLLTEYVRAMDFGEIDSVARVFTDGGRVRDVQNRMWDSSTGGPRGFAERWLVPPLSRRGQHWIQRVKIEKLSDDRCRVLSYWSSIRWDHDVSATPVMGVLGTYTDTCVRVDGRWLIEEKVIDAWKSEGMESPPLKA